MSDYARDGLDLDDEDRLPWLEPADGYDDADGLSPLKLLGFILLGLLLLGAIVGAIWWVKDRQDSSVSGGRLIASPIGDYKVPANEAGAKFDGEGDASFAASEGVERDGKIDVTRMPEVPVTAGGTAGAGAGTAAKADAAKPAAKVSAKVADATKPETKAPTAAPAASGTLVQLGAYGSQAIAKESWGKLAKRFPYLEPLAMTIQPVEIGSTTLYRLRASAGSTADATALCGKLKVAGENCLVVR